MSETVTWEEFIHEGYILNANDIKGKHWTASSGKVEILRQRGNVQRRKLDRYDRVRLTAVVSYPDRVARDSANLHPTLKAYVDGLVNGMPEYKAVMKGGKLKRVRLAPDRNTGILPDDSDLFLAGPHIEWSGRRSPLKDHFRFEFALEELEPLVVEADAVGPALMAKVPVMLV